MNMTRMVRALLLTAGMGAFVTAHAQLPVNPDTPPTFLLLGEVHDNPDGHQQRYNDLRARVEAGWRPAIAMEQFDRERNGDLQKALQTCADAQCVIDKAGAPRWDWKLYTPVIALAMQYKLPIIAANVSRTHAAQILRDGFKAALTDADIGSFGLPESISPQLRKGQADAIVNGHCGYQPDAKLLNGFVDAQVARDIWMAKAMIDNRTTGVVLLAGNGHVRNDLGVAYWLKYKHMDNVQTVGYLESDQSDVTAFDVVHKIPPHERPDPCAGLKMPAR